jgi:hypothetical protein
MTEFVSKKYLYKFTLTTHFFVYEQYTAVCACIFQNDLWIFLYFGESFTNPWSAPVKTWNLAYLEILTYRYSDPVKTWHFMIWNTQAYFLIVAMILSIRGIWHTWGLGCPTLDFIIALWIMVTFYTLLTSLFCITYTNRQLMMSICC